MKMSGSCSQVAVHKKNYFPNTSEGLESEINDDFEKEFQLANHSI